MKKILHVTASRRHQLHEEYVRRTSAKPWQADDQSDAATSSNLLRCRANFTILSDGKFFQAIRILLVTAAVHRFQDYVAQGQLLIEFAIFIHLLYLNKSSTTFGWRMIKIYKFTLWGHGQEQYTPVRVTAWSTGLWTWQRETVASTQDSVTWYAVLGVPVFSCIKHMNISIAIQRLTMRDNVLRCVASQYVR